MQSENALNALETTDSSATGDTASAESKAGLSGQVRRAIFWRTGTQILSQIISWTVTLIVIRILNPADYGLYAMAQVMMTFLDFLNGYGFASALIQQKEVTRHAIRQALGLQILMNAMMAAMQFAAAPIIADYYGQPVVADILHVLCFIYLFTPFIIVPEVLLARTLDLERDEAPARRQQTDQVRRADAEPVATPTTSARRARAPAATRQDRPAMSL